MAEILEDERNVIKGDLGCLTYRAYTSSGSAIWLATTDHFTSIIDIWDTNVLVRNP